MSHPLQEGSSHVKVSFQRFRKVPEVWCSRVPETVKSAMLVLLSAAPSSSGGLSGASGGTSSGGLSGGLPETAVGAADVDE